MAIKKFQYEHALAQSNDYQLNLESGMRRVVLLKAEYQDCQVTVDKAQVEKHNFLESYAEKHYFLGDNLHNDKHCFIAKGDVTTICRRLSVDAYSIEQLRDVHKILKNGRFEKNMDGNSLQIGRRKTYLGAKKSITYHTIITHQHILFPLKIKAKQHSNFQLQQPISTCFTIKTKAKQHSNFQLLLHVYKATLQLQQLASNFS